MTPSSGTSHPSSEPPEKFYTPFRLFSFLILLLMGGAIVYALGISIYHWSGIAV